MLEDLLAVRVLAFRNVADLLQQGEVDVRLDVTGNARVPVPVPGSTEVGRRVDESDLVEALLAQPRPGHQAAEASANDDDLDLVVERLAGEVRVGPGVVGVVGERPIHLDVLVGAVRPQALFALGAVPVPDLVQFRQGLRRLVIGDAHLLRPLWPTS